MKCLLMANLKYKTAATWASLCLLGKTYVEEPWNLMEKKAF